MKQSNFDPFVVIQSLFESTRLVDEDNNYHQQISSIEAIEKAKKANLDLVCFNMPSKNDLALCKIINFGKWKYDNEKQKKKQKVHAKATKEIRFTYDIAENDINHKMRQVNDFLDEGHDVVLSMLLKGRQKIYLKEAEEKMNGVLNLCGKHGHEISRKKNSGLIVIRVGKGNTAAK